ncbi:MAG: TolC family outer membrane protein [Alphaproteobacteria bacterium]|nr:TolC family outer membrane protein [Alphaproteobacteria bacterium]
MIDRIVRSLLISSCLVSASAAMAATGGDQPTHYLGNEVTVDIPDEVPVVELKPVETTQPAEELLGSKSDEAPAPVELSTDKKYTLDAPAAAPTEEENALQQVLSYVYEHHPQLLAEREKVKAVDESVALAVSEFRPNIGADYSKGRERQKSSASNRFYGDTQSQGITVTQPIFSGLDSVAGFKAAKERVKAARADLTALEQQILYNAIVAYTGVVEADAVLKLNQNNVDVLTKQREATQVRFDVGELTRTDVSQSEARLANAKAAEQQSIGDLAIARANFLRAVGMPAPEHPVMPAVPGSLPKTLKEASALARNASPVLEAAKHREQAFENDIDVRIGSILPDISLQGTVRRNEGGNAFVNKYSNDALTLNVSIPLYQSGSEWAQLRAAHNMANQARFNTLDTTLAVEQDVTSAWQNYVTAESVITSTEAAEKAAGLALEGVRQESDFGVRTVLDVLDAEQEFMNTKVNLVRATRNHKIQAYRLLASVGKLTAEALTLPVKVYNPAEHYDDVKYQLLGL